MQIALVLIVFFISFISSWGLNQSEQPAQLKSFKAEKIISEKKNKITFSENKIDTLKLKIRKIKDKQESIILDKIGKDQTTQNLVGFLKANELENTDPEMEQVRLHFHEKAKLNPKKTIEKIREILAMNKNELSAVNRLRILSLAGDLNADPEVVIEIGRKEIENTILPKRPLGAELSQLSEEQTNQALSVKLDTLIPATALALVVNHLDDKNEALKITIDGIKIQKDWIAQREMSNAFLMKHPTEQGNLLAELKHHEIIIPGINQSSEGKFPASNETVIPDDAEISFVKESLIPSVETP